MQYINMAELHTNKRLKVVRDAVADRSLATWAAWGRGRSAEEPPAQAEEPPAPPAQAEEPPAQAEEPPAPPAQAEEPPAQAEEPPARPRWLWWRLMVPKQNQVLPPPHPIVVLLV